MEVPRPLKHLLQDQRTTDNFRSVLRTMPTEIGDMDPNAPEPPPLPSSYEDSSAPLDTKSTMSVSASSSRHISRHNSTEDASRPSRRSQEFGVTTHAPIFESSTPTVHQEYHNEDDVALLRQTSSSPPLILGAIPKVSNSTHTTIPEPPQFSSVLPIPPPPLRVGTFSAAKQIISTPCHQPVEAPPMVLTSNLNPICVVRPVNSV